MVTVGISRRWTASLVLLGVALACGSPPDAPDTDEPPGGFIAFDRLDVGATEQGNLHWIDTEGTGLSELPLDFWAEGEPSWSPDGTRLAFSGVGANSEESTGILYLDVETEEVIRVTDGPDASATWSPDGERIAFSRGTFRGGPSPKLMELLVVDVDGSRETELTDNLFIDAQPSWSPDGDQIAFSSNRAGSPDIWTMTPDGNEAIPLTDTPDGDIGPEWSPTGDEIAFSRRAVSDEDGGLYLMNPDGSDLRRLPGEGLSIGAIAWSPDGSWLAFAGYDDETTNIYLIHRDGTGLRPLTEDDYQAFNPTWQP